jgi:hypothetical protein
MGLLARFSHKKKSPGDTASSERNKAKPAFRGVRIVANHEDCCQFARTLEDERFLLQEAPMLPLSLCDVETCRCTYERFDDRRAGARRASDIAFDINSALHSQENRSSKVPGRRSKDSCDF